MSIRSYPFGTMSDGRPVTAYEITAGECRAEILDLGCIVNRLYLPDKNGKVEDIVLGCDTVEDLMASPHFGAAIGRYGNRIDKGHFVLDGKEFQLPCNDNGNHLHGGANGFDRLLWKAEPYNADGQSICFSYTSPAGEANYPGTLDVSVSYSFTESGLTIVYHAETSDATPVNLTNHSYFNLAGEGSGDVKQQQFQIFASEALEGREDLIPTGDSIHVEGTAFDFREMRSLADAMAAGEQDPQLQLPACGGGFDHNFILDKGIGMELAAEAYDPVSGRHMTVMTDQPGMQFYTGNALKDVAGKGGKRYGKHDAFCMETQHFPDSPNHPEWPTTILRPNEEYDSVTVYRFDVR